VSAIDWILASEPAVGKGHPILADVDNRPLRQILSKSGYDPDAAFPGFLGPVFNIKAYGAVGDGVTDDTAAIQAALTAAALGGQLVVPAGDYFCTSQVSVGSNISIIGLGRKSRIFVTNQAIQNLWRGQNVTNVRIERLFFDGAGTNHTDVNTTTCLRFEGSSNLRIINCDFERWDDPTLMDNCSDIQVEGNHYAKNSGSGLLAMGVSYGTITGNTWDGLRTGIGDGVKGQSFVSLAEGSAVPGVWTNGITCSTNSVRNCSADAFFLQCHHCTFTGNVIDVCNNGYTLQAGFNENAQPVVAGSNNTIVGGSVKGAVNNGAVIQPSPTKTAAPHHNTLKGVQFDGGLIGIVLSADAYENDISVTVKGCSSHGLLFASGGTQSRNKIHHGFYTGCGGSGIDVRGNGVGNQIEMNFVYKAGVHGIVQEVDTPVDTMIQGNSCQDNDSGDLGSRRGIQVATGMRPVVRNNKCFCSDTAHFQTLGINIVAGVTDAVVTDNDCRNNRTTTNGLNDAGTRTYLRGNQRVAGGLMRGTAVLVAGTVTVSTTEILAGDTVMLTNITTGGTLGILSRGTIVANTSVVINSSNAADTSTIAWEIVH
jgi:pectate lyase-like protein